MSLRDDLIAAKALIDTPDRWCKGRYTDGEKRCAVGAMDAVSDDRSYGGMRLALIKALPGMHHGISAFNDAPATTHADIMALFDRAIAAEASSHV